MFELLKKMQFVNEKLQQFSNSLKYCTMKYRESYQTPYLPAQ